MTCQYDCEVVCLTNSAFNSLDDTVTDLDLPFIQPGLMPRFLEIPR